MVSARAVTSKAGTTVEITHSPSRRHHIYIITTLCCIGVLLRAGFDWYLLHRTPQTFWAFGTEPSRIAESIVRGEGFSSPFTSSRTGPTAWVPPVYPLIIAVSFRLFGVFSAVAVYFMLWINLLCAVATTVLLYEIGLICFTPRVAFAGAVLWTVSPDMVVMPALNWDSNPGALLATSVVLLFLQILQSPAKKVRWILFGVLWGVCGLTSSILLALMLSMIALFLIENGKFRWRVVMTLAITLAALTPWTIRNYLQFGSFVPVRSNFGAELWAGNHPGVSGPADESVQPLRSGDELKAYLTMGEIRYVALRRHQAIDFILSNPRRFAELTKERFVSFWLSPRMLSVGWLFACTLLAWASLVSLLLRGKTRHLAAPFASALLVFPVLYYISHAESRFRFPIEPLVLLLAANAVMAFIDFAAGLGKAELRSQPDASSI